MTLEALRCSTRSAPISRFGGGARVGGVHKLWLRSRTDSSRYARKNAANLTLKHSIIFMVDEMLVIVFCRCEGTRLIGSMVSTFFFSVPLWSPTFTVYVCQNGGSKFQFADLIIYTLIIDTSIASPVIRSAVFFFFLYLSSLLLTHKHIHYLIRFLFVDFTFIQFHFSTPIGNECSQAIICFLLSLGIIECFAYLLFVLFLLS